MGILHRVGSFLTRSGVNNPIYWITKHFGGSAAGVNVTADNAIKVSAVYACVKVVSETIASLPLMLYKRKGNGKDVAQDHYLYPLLHDAPNDFMTSFEWREGLMAHQLLRGNSYNLKVQKASGKIVELRPLNPANMEIVVDEGQPVYLYKHEDGKEEKYTSDKIWHVKNLPISSAYSGGLPEGIKGLSPISAAKESIGIAIAADDYSGRYFQNNASVGMALKYPAGVKLSDNAKEYLKDSLAEYGKAENKFKSIVLENGGELTKVGMSNEDSQFIESRQFSVEEIARIFRVPPVMIGHPTNTMTYASAEQLFLSFANYTIAPWCKRLEQSMNRYLLTDKERKEYFFEFNMAGLLRGDLAGRYQAYAVARQWGFMSVNEIRSLENWNPIEGEAGDIYLQPMNMVEAGTEYEPKQLNPTDEPKAELEKAEETGGEDA